MMIGAYFGTIWWHSRRKLQVRGFCAEIWKPCVSEFLNVQSPDLEVSNLGRLRRIRTGHVMKGFKFMNGSYIGASVRKKCGKLSKVGIHRLVCTIFNGPPHTCEKSWVHHKNHNPKDNRAVNLVWVTPSENATFYHQTFPGRKSKVSVLQWNMEAIFLQEFPSVNLAAQSLNVKPCQISSAISRKMPLKGFFWTRKISNKVNHIDGEIWKQLSSHQNYEVSSLGRVRNSKKNTLLSGSGSYRSVYIEWKRYYVHRLVAFYHCENLDEKPHVDHIDGNPRNNNCKNLR